MGQVLDWPEVGSEVAGEIVLRPHPQGAVVSLHPDAVRRGKRIVECVAVGGGLAFNADPPIKGLVDLLQGGTKKTETKLRRYARGLAEQITQLGLLDTFPFDSIGLAALLFEDCWFDCVKMGAKILKCGKTAPDFDGNVCTAPDETTALWFSDKFPSNGKTFFCETFKNEGSEEMQTRIREMTY